MKRNKPTAAALVDDKAISIKEANEYQNYALMEALSPDPTRADVLTWITSYDSLWHVAGRPLWDLLQRGRRGEDARMLFSWYSGDYCTDPDFRELPPEERANPSMGAWTNPRYLEEQRLRLPSHKYRRLHLNLGGQPEGAFFSGESILAWSKGDARWLGCRACTTRRTWT